MANFAARALDVTRLAVAIASLTWAVAVAQIAEEPEELEGDFRPAPVSPATEDSDARREQDLPQGLTLALAAGPGYDDNVFRTETDTRSGWFWNARPGAYLDGSFGKHDFRLGYEGDYRSYFEFDTENFYDHRVLARAGLDLTRKVDVNLSGHVLWGHDDRGGLGARLAASRDLDVWREQLARAELVVGREITRAQIMASVEVARMRYLNNDQSARDFDRETFWGRGRWRFTPRFWGLAETGISNIHHLDASNNLDRVEPEVLVGFGWDATAKTSGEILIGALNREFEDSGRGSTSNFTYDARIDWAPKPYSRGTFYANRESLEDASGGLGTVLAATVGVRWRHAFSERMELDGGFEFTNADYDAGREDEYLSFEVGLVGQLNDWLNAGVHYEHTRRRSNVPGIDYVDNIILLELSAMLQKRL